MTRTYIAGGMTGIKDFNYPAFADMERYLLNVMDCAHEVLNPITIADGDTTQPYEFYIRESIKMLLRANAVVFLEGWEKSNGARLEHSIAKALKLKMYNHNLEILKENE